AELADQRLRIAGRVKPGSISWEPSTLTLKFEMVQIPDPSAEPVRPVANSDPTVLRVVCAGQPKPDMFGPGRDVIVEGTLGSGAVVKATQVMTSCPSKYKPKQAQ